MRSIEEAMEVAAIAQESLVRIFEGKDLTNYQRGTVRNAISALGQIADRDTTKWVVARCTQCELPCSVWQEAGQDHHGLECPMPDREARWDILDEEKLMDEIVATLRTHGRMSIHQARDTIRDEFNLGFTASEKLLQKLVINRPQVKVHPQTLEVEE